MLSRMITWTTALPRVCQENVLVIANTVFQQHQRRLYTWTSPDSQYQNQIDYILCSQRWRKKEKKMKLLSHARLFVTPWTVACTKLLCPWDFQGKRTGVGCHFLLQEIFPTQGLNPGVSHYRQTTYHPYL